ANAGWNRVVNLSGAQRIVIRTRDGRLVHAAFVEADDVSLTVLTGRVRQSFARADIVDVTSAPEGSRVGAYIGASLGLVIGFALGASVGLGCNSHCSGGDITGEWLALIGPPVRLGLFGYHEFRGLPAPIYVAP